MQITPNNKLDEQCSQNTTDLLPYIQTNKRRYYGDIIWVQKRIGHQRSVARYSSVDSESKNSEIKKERTLMDTKRRITEEEKE